MQNFLLNCVVLEHSSDFFFHGWLLVLCYLNCIYSEIKYALFNRLLAKLSEAPDSRVGNDLGYYD